MNAAETILTKHAPHTYLRELCDKHGSDKQLFCPVYEFYLHENRLKALNFLEIGVGGYKDPQAGGASVRMWKEYFPSASIYALDLFDKSPHEEERIKIYQGSQDDKAVLNKIADEIGRIDSIIDDGSHFSRHVIVSFETLFPRLAPGGLYFIEDIGTSYRPDWDGSHDLNDPKTSVNYFKRLADGINARHFGKPYQRSYADQNAAYVHFYDNLIVVRKK